MLVRLSLMRDGEPTQRYDGYFAKLHDPSKPTLPNGVPAFPFATATIRSAQAKLQVGRPGPYAFELSGRDGVVARALLPVTQVSPPAEELRYSLCLSEKHDTVLIEGSVSLSSDLVPTEEDSALSVQDIELRAEGPRLVACLKLRTSVDVGISAFHWDIPLEGAVALRATAVATAPASIVSVDCRDVLPRSAPDVARRAMRLAMPWLPVISRRYPEIRGRIAALLQEHIDTAIADRVGGRERYVTLHEIESTEGYLSFRGVVAEVQRREAQNERPPHAEDDRFTFVKLLSRPGADSIVEEVDDRFLGRHVARKTLKDIDGPGIESIKREFRTLHGLDHQHIVRAYELLQDDHSCSFTMGLVEGRDVVSAIRSIRRPVASELLTPAPTSNRIGLLRLVVEAISALHRAGHIHGDLKADHVLVTEDQVVLIDLGSAERIGEPSTGRGGTAHYRAPERAAGALVTSSWDWYSFGVLLLEMLGDEPDEPVLLGLARLLTADNPVMRPDETEIRLRLGMLPAPMTIPTAPATFVGRQKELSLLRQAYGAKHAERRPKIFVTGPSGVGKTALVDELVRRLEAESARILVLRSRCRALETIPYHAFAEIFEGVAKYLQRRAYRGHRRELLPKDLRSLAQLFPCLFPLCEEVTETAPIQERELRRRASAAARELFANLSKHKPVVLVIDDFQRGDERSRELLDEIFTPPVFNDLLLIATERTHESGKLDEHCIDLEKLDEEQAHDLAAMLLRTQDPPLTWPTDKLEAEAGIIARAAGGHPMFLQWLVRDACTNQHGPRGTLHDVIARAIHRLPAHDRQLLELVCLSKGALRLETLAGVMDMDTARLLEAGKRLHRLQLARLSEAAALEPYHDRVRNVVCDLIHEEVPEGVQRSWHAKLADVLGRAPAGQYPPELVIRHLQAAGQREAAAHRAMEVAHSALHANRREEAAELYRMALELMDTTRLRERSAVLRNLADVLSERGYAADAGLAYSKAARYATAESAFDCHRKAAEQYLSVGCVTRGKRHLRCALDRIREPDTSAWDRLKVLGWRLPASVPRWEKRDSSTIAAETLATVDLFLSAALGLAFVAHSRSAELCRRGLSLACKIGEPIRVARACALQAMLIAARSPGRPALAEPFSREAQKASTTEDDPLLRGHVTMAEGWCAYYHGEMSASVDKFRQAERELQGLEESRTGSEPREHGYQAAPLNYVRIGLLLALQHAGNYQEVADVCKRLLPAAQRAKDNLTTGVLQIGFPLILKVLGDVAPVEGALTDRARTAAGPSLVAWLRLRAVEELDLYRDWRLAMPEVDAGDGDIPSARRQGTSTTIPPPAEPAVVAPLDQRFEPFLAGPAPALGALRAEQWWLRARLSLVQALLGVDKRSAVGRARKCARRLRREGTPHAAVWASLVEAALDTQRGRSDAAARRLEDELGTADRIGMRMCAAVMHRRLGQLTGNTDHLSRAERLMSTEGVLEAEQLAWVIAPGFVL